MQDNDHNIEVPTGSLRIVSNKPTVWNAIEYYREHPLWMIVAVTLVALPPIIGYAISGIWGILFGWMAGAAGFYAGAKALVKV
ncbi:MAG: hypothetical protein O7D88_01585, partial [Gammaproteobacteria bacterium]|nr:hypothetical protein [Gammaproteobacteria bacterium]